MNDDIRLKLSAYLDGELSDSERRAVEVEISRSEEVRGELESLRAVSAAVKGMPQEKLPDGFMARLEARRGRETAEPRADYFLLPPSYRPVALALSSAIVAMVIWDRAREPEAGTRIWDGSKPAMIKSAAEAPPSIDVSGKLSAMNGAAGVASDGTKKEAPVEEAAAEPKFGAASTFGKHLNAPGKPLEVREEEISAKPQAAPLATAPPSAADSVEPEQDGKGAFRARNEEERSAINERLYRGFEDEKKRMGIAKILEKDEKQGSGSAAEDIMTLGATPSPARAEGGRSIAAMRGASQGKGGAPAAPAVKAIALKSAEALQAAWAAAGLPGDPPAIAFPREMAVFLAGPPGSGIVSVQNRKKLIVVLYKDAGFDDASARVRAMPFATKPLVVKLAE